MKRTSIRFRLMVLMICLTTIPVTIVTWYATRNTIDTVEKEIVSNTISQMSWADQYFNELIEHLDILFYSLQIDQQFIQSIDEIDITEDVVKFRGQNYIPQNYIQDLLKSVLYANSNKIEEMAIYINSNMKVYSVDLAEIKKPYTIDIEDGAWNRMLAKPINMYFKYYENNLVVFHSINRFPNKSLIGGISLIINNKSFERAQEILKSSSTNPVFVLNDEGELLTNNQDDYLAQEQINIQNSINNLMNSKIKVEKTNKNYYFIKKINDGQITIMKIIPLEEITQSAYRTIKAGILIGALFALLSVLLSILFSLKITRPIVSLAKTMKMAQIDSFELKIIESHDEIGLLESGYNSMMLRIKNMIKDEYEKNIELKNSQLKALQAQINPHFLNNTLQLIGGIALSKNIPEIYQITKVIGDLLRYAISSQGDLVLLKNELQHTRNYLFIQENRFKGRCKIIDLVDSSILDVKLPKFTLQPIIENAFEHGLQQKEGPWKMVIRGKRIGNRIIIIVKDNGVGLSSSRLKKIREDLKAGYKTNIEDDIDLNTYVNPSLKEIKVINHRKREGIGLRNVNARLILHFGPKYGCRIYSNAGVGTIVVLTLPAFTKEDEQSV